MKNKIILHKAAILGFVIVLLGTLFQTFPIQWNIYTINLFDANVRECAIMAYGVTIFFVTHETTKVLKSNAIGVFRTIPIHKIILRIVPPIVISTTLAYMIGLIPLYVKCLTEDGTRLPSLLNILGVIVLIIFFAVIGFTIGRLIQFKVSPLISLVALYGIVQLPLSLSSSDSATGLSFKSIAPIWSNLFPYTDFVLETKLLLVRVFMAGLFIACILGFQITFDNKKLFENVKVMNFKLISLIILPCVFAGLVIFQQPYLVAIDQDLDYLCKANNDNSINVCVLASQKNTLDDYYDISIKIISDFQEYSHETYLIIGSGIDISLKNKKFNDLITNNQNRNIISSSHGATEDFYIKNMAIQIASNLSGYDECLSSNDYENMPNTIEENRKGDVNEIFMLLNGAILQNSGIDVKFKSFKGLKNESYN